MFGLSINSIFSTWWECLIETAIDKGFPIRTSIDRDCSIQTSIYRNVPINQHPFLEHFLLKAPFTVDFPPCSNPLQPWFRWWHSHRPPMRPSVEEWAVAASDTPVGWWLGYEKLPNSHWGWFFNPSCRGIPNSTNQDSMKWERDFQHFSTGKLIMNH